MRIHAEIINVRLELHGIYGGSSSYNIKIVHLRTLQTSQHLSYPAPQPFQNYQNHACLYFIVSCDLHCDVCGQIPGCFNRTWKHD